MTAAKTELQVLSLCLTTVFLLSLFSEQVLKILFDEYVKEILFPF